MDINMQKRNEVSAQNVIKGLESRNMSGYYAADREAAVKQALELICLLYTSPSPRDATLSRMPSSA